ncbi:MAG TPA: hypothetical protein VK655_05720, partial [Solirubrobacteraceae bacterium]|nr:hypothetical protein [Solirubrobacteraceae bacterium]
PAALGLPAGLASCVAAPLPPALPSPADPALPSPPLAAASWPPARPVPFACAEDGAATPPAERGALEDVAGAGVDAALGGDPAGVNDAVAPSSLVCVGADAAASLLASRLDADAALLARPAPRSFVAEPAGAVVVLGTERFAAGASAGMDVESPALAAAALTSAGAGPGPTGADAALAAELAAAADPPSSALWPGAPATPATIASCVAPALASSPAPVDVDVASVPERSWAGSPCTAVPAGASPDSVDGAAAEA